MMPYPVCVSRKTGAVTHVSCMAGVATLVRMAASSPDSIPRPRVMLLANLSKPQVTEALKELRPWLEQRAEIVVEADSHAMNPEVAMKQPEADLAIVLGGDGTLLAAARAMAARSVPLLGVNFGKLGFLAEFSLAEMMDHWPVLAAGRSRTTSRILLEVKVHHARRNGEAGHREPVREKETPRSENGRHEHAPAFECLAVNDVVITAGPPFRMIDLELIIDPHAGNHFSTLFTADGVIVSTPSGSTAYNLAAGGPIVSPLVDAICVTPLCPHSLSFRPIVTRADADTRIRLMRGNEGTTLVIDGQNSVRLFDGSEVRIRRSDRSFTLVNNPSLSYWKLLAKKLHWAARPRRG